MANDKLQILNLPRPVPPERMRDPQDNIPATRGQRERMKLEARAYVEAYRPVPPLSFDELRRHSDQLIAIHSHDPKFRDYVAVLINSEVWRDSLASVPYGRRLLLLPKCLRVEDRCPAPFDEFGLLCKQCGLCSIQELQNEAERLGYAVLCAEGSALVMAIIQTGKIDAIVGVSCLSVLEKAFPYMESSAIPGVAIPLLQDDCKDTSVDMDWVWDTIHLTSDDRTYRMDLDGLRREVDAWFAPAELDRIMGPAQTRTERIAREWLGKSGKRWRPFLAACAYKALAADPQAPLPDGLKAIAVAVECFHKASLVHDDIEDNDDLRYGEKTLHAEYGVPVALNAGDLLLGEGYRLIGAAGARAEIEVEMLRIAAAGHRTLCLGQGAELCWAREPAPLSPVQVLDIFRQKTAPAFEVALRLGAAFAGAGPEIGEVLARYSEALGIAYQIRDDIEDLAAGHAPDDISKGRPSLPMAIAFERAKGAMKQEVAGPWHRTSDAIALQAKAAHCHPEGSGSDPKDPAPNVAARPEDMRATTPEPDPSSQAPQDDNRGSPAQDASGARMRQIISELRVEERCHSLLDSYKEEAVRSLAQLENASLKGLLRRVVSKVFGVEIKGWCSEFEARNAASRAPGAATAG